MVENSPKIFASDEKANMRLLELFFLLLFFFFFFNLPCKFFFCFFFFLFSSFSSSTSSSSSCDNTGVDRVQKNGVELQHLEHATVNKHADKPLSDRLTDDTAKPPLKTTMAFVFLLYRCYLTISTVLGQ